MTEKMIAARVASFITLRDYHNLKNMELMGGFDSDTYRSVAEKLKKHFNVENEQYDMVPLQDVDSFLEKACKSDTLDSIDARCYLKYKERKKELTGDRLIGEHILLSSVISSKLYIDILKDVDCVINSLGEKDTLDPDDFEMLRMYHINYKYHYLTANRFLEQIAINSYFNIASLPDFSFAEIEEAYGVKFMNNIQNILYDYVTSAISELASYETDDKYLLSYISIFEVARVKVMLPYLSEENLDKVIESYKDNKYSYDKNGALRKVKKLIKKRKEEFSA